MRKVAFGVLGVACALIGLVAAMNILYNAAGCVGSGDAASGSKMETGLVALLFAVLATAAFYGSYRSFRAAFSKRDFKN